ncbi:MAG: hypothetical protein LBE52_15160 [Providencia sp.]|jgi:adhesin HecA-like repeat protein|nr:hypothetical protein [Providencia sp.]
MVTSTSYGKIQGDRSINLDVNTLNNTYSGLVNASKDLTINAFTYVTNNNGRLSSNETTTITSSAIYNSPYGQIVGKTIIIDSPYYN